MNVQPYTYTPLRSDEIRVLQLKRSERLEDPLECSMHRLKIDDESQTPQKNKLTYATLSYTWGHTSSDGSHLTHVLYCDGCTLRITASLDQGLRRIRAIDPSWWEGFHGYDDNYPAKRQPPLLWVDQACIDQAHLVERNHEVSRMANIYKRSACMIIWLGEAQDEDGLRYREAITRDAPGHEPKSLLETQWRNALDYFRPNWSYEQEPEQRMSTFTELLHRPWWSRRWCIPEVVNTMDGVQFMLIGQTILRQRDVRFASYVLAPAHTGRVDALHQPHRHTLRYLLQECYVAQCTLEHDIIYSLIQLAKDADSYGLEVDYSQPFEDVCRAISNGALHPRNGIGAHAFQLIVIAASWGASPSAGLPSWIPDWRVPLPYSCHEHKLVTELYAYPDYQVSSHYLQVEDNNAYLKGELVRPCFPPKHGDLLEEANHNCSCCTYWHQQYFQWTEGLRLILCNATSDGQMLFIPSFPRTEELWEQLQHQQIVFIVSESFRLKSIDNATVYTLQSCFQTTRRQHGTNRNDNTWICLG